jgi:ATP-binding cassette, subfamily B, bacterial
LSYTSWALEGAAVGARRVFEVLDEGDAVPESPGAIRLPVGKGRIEMEEVGFSYEPGKRVLEGLNLTIEAGQTVALVGGSGCGKTTVLSLVPRFYDVQSGVVKVDGEDVRRVTKQSLRERMAMVLQETVLLSATVRENIAYGRAGASEGEIEMAARAAQAHEFIQALPRGYDTWVGERGARLSGGQRQRIGIARAFLRQAPILLMDEPTSSLDLETEEDLVAALNALMRRQTTLLVSQRLATIHEVDCIHVMENGRIVESGKGPELLAKNGVYARLWEAGKNTEIRRKV